MAEALCGPSNALQSFRKHASIDRTLQQDRVVSRNSPGSGFRSSPGPNVGLLDPEFEAFQAGFNPSFESQLAHHLDRPAFAQSPASIFSHQPPPAAWASDFQRLNISEPQPSQALHHSIASHAQDQASAGWHQDFQAYQQHTTAASQNFHASQLQPYYVGQSQSNAQHSSAGYHTPLMLQNQRMTLQEHGIQQEIGKGKQRVEVKLDAADFERAFEAHAEELLRQESELQARSPTELGQDVLMDDSSTAEALRDRIDQLREESMHLAAEEMMRSQNHEQEVMKGAKQERPQSPNTDDDLAQTAGDLLDRVADNATQKFQDSNFLALMRRLRDREIRVEGDKMVETDGFTAPPQETPYVQDTMDHGRITMFGALPLPQDSSFGSGEEGPKRARTQQRNHSQPSESTSNSDEDSDDTTRHELPGVINYQYHHLIDDF